MQLRPIAIMFGTLLLTLGVVELFWIVGRLIDQSVPLDVAAEPALDLATLAAQAPLLAGLPIGLGLLAWPPIGRFLAIGAGAYVIISLQELPVVLIGDTPHDPASLQWLVGIMAAVLLLEPIVRMRHDDSVASEEPRPTSVSSSV